MIDDQDDAPKGAVLRDYTAFETMILQNDATMRRLQELGMKWTDALELIGRRRRRTR